jgi:UDP-2,4-diacetamido-2,4,6-trideoxy-beta-L-altropyranose hydrolase
MSMIENKGVTLVIRADASIAGGTGHVMRCLALAQACKARGWEVGFVLAQSTSNLDSRFLEAGIPVSRADVTPGSSADATRTIEAARAAKASWIVADGYKFDSAWQREIKAADLRLLLLDDYGHADHYYADLVLNQNLHASERAYANREAYTRLLLGPRFVLLRDEFVKHRKLERKISDRARKILVTLGGSDPHNVSRDVLETLARMRDLEITVVVGGSNPHLQTLRRLVTELPEAAISIAVDTYDMPELMDWADVAIAAGGTTSWELAFSGLPSMVLTLADNQEAISAALDRAGLAINIGRWNVEANARLARTLPQLLSDSRRRERMSHAGRQLVDGLGARRVLVRMSASQLNLRAAREDDCFLIWEWANDPETRQVSFSSEPIAWETHQEWYARTVRAPNSFFYIGSNASGDPVGQIRFQLDGQRATVSVSLAKEARGKGLGAALIVCGVTQFLHDSDAEIVDAYVKPDNNKSVKTFTTADFVDAGIAEVHGQAAQHFVFRRDYL